MAESYETTLSPRGQIVIGKRLREKAGLRPFQKVVERIERGKIVLEPKRSVWDIPPIRGKGLIDSTNLEDALYGPIPRQTKSTRKRPAR